MSSFLELLESYSFSIFSSSSTLFGILGFLKWVKSSSSASSRSREFKLSYWSEGASGSILRSSFDYLLRSPGGPCAPTASPFSYNEPSSCGPPLAFFSYLSKNLLKVDLRFFYGTLLWSEEFGMRSSKRDD